MISDLDGALLEYCARVTSAVERGRLSAAPLVASPKHDLEGAVRFPGVTLISPPGPHDLRSWPTYQRLGALQIELRERHPTSLIMTAPENLHITGADLVAGPSYLDQVAQAAQGAETYLRALTNALKSATSAERPSLSEEASTWRYAGLSLFGSALVALFIPERPQGYQALCQRRAELYGDPSLYQLGVRPPRPLMAHATLAYFTTALGADLSAQADLEHHICALNTREAHRGSMTLSLDRLTLYTFEDMERYTLATTPLSISL